MHKIIGCSGAERAWEFSFLHKGFAHQWILVHQRNQHIPMYITWQGCRTRHLLRTDTAPPRTPETAGNENGSPAITTGRRELSWKKCWSAPQSHRFSFLLEGCAGVRSPSNKKGKLVQPQLFRATTFSSHTFLNHLHTTENPTTPLCNTYTRSSIDRVTKSLY